MVKNANLLCDHTLILAYNNNNIASKHYITENGIGQNVVNSALETIYKQVCKMFIIHVWLIPCHVMVITHSSLWCRCPSAWAQLEPNTLIEAEGLSANAKARAEALRLTRR